ncbi:hypothetical protein YC2023_114677 [Brassica napus]
MMEIKSLFGRMIENENQIHANHTEEEHLPFHLRIAEYDVDERGEPSTEPSTDPSRKPSRESPREPSRDPSRDPESGGDASGGDPSGGEPSERRSAVETKYPFQSPRERTKETRKVKLDPKSILPLRIFIGHSHDATYLLRTRQNTS